MEISVAQAAFADGSGGSRRFVYVVASVVALGGLLFAHFLVPETRGRSLERIETDPRSRVTGGS